MEVLVCISFLFLLCYEGVGVCGLQIGFLKIFTNKRLNSTEGLKRASKALGVSPPWNAPSWLWTFSWKLHQWLLPFFHSTDKCNANETFVNLPVLWWKAIAGNRRGSKLDDQGFAYDLLPPFTRMIVSYPLCWLFPNLHHQNVAMRTVYLDKALDRCLEETVKLDKQISTVEIVTFGAGFDTRSLRYLNNDSSKNSRFLHFHEFDLSHVVQSKNCMFQRLIERRKSQNIQLPKLYSCDLNHENQITSALNQVKGDIHSRPSKGERTIIFVFEAVAMYLNPGATERLLELCNQFIHNNGVKTSYLCFTDRFPSTNAGLTDLIEEEKQLCQVFLNRHKFQLLDFLPKPGRARHMGLAIFQGTS